jgi:hypothetical protein
VFNCALSHNRLECTKSKIPAVVLIWEVKGNISVKGVFILIVVVLLINEKGRKNKRKER